MLLGNANSNRVYNDLTISQSVENEIRQLVIKGNLPSLQVAIVSDNQIIWSKTFGKTAGKLQLYKIGSIRKVIGSTAVLQLHESGLLNINEDINKYIPVSVRNPRFPDSPVSIKMLLAHRSGLDIFKYQYEWDTRNLEYNHHI